MNSLGNVFWLSSVASGTHSTPRGVFLYSVQASLEGVDQAETEVKVVQAVVAEEPGLVERAGEGDWDRVLALRDAEFGYASGIPRSCDVERGSLWLRE